MKQETGNNNFAEPSRELSIQITLGGFSFCVTQNGEFLYGSNTKSYEFGTVIGSNIYSSVYVGWSCNNVMLIPAEVFDEQYAVAYLRAENILSPMSRAVYNHTFDHKITALWAVNSAVYDAVEALFPEAYHYHNLQVDTMLTRRESVRVSVVENIANVVVATQEGMYAAETIEVSNVEDLLYFVSKLNMVDKFSRHALDFTADETEPFREIFSRQFPCSNFTTDKNFYHSKMLRCEL